MNRNRFLAIESICNEVYEAEHLTNPELPSMILNWLNHAGSALTDYEIAAAIITFGDYDEHIPYSDIQNANCYLFYDIVDTFLTLIAFDEYTMEQNISVAELLENEGGFYND